MLKKGYCIFENKKLNPSCEEPACCAVLGPGAVPCGAVWCRVVLEPGAVVLCWDFPDSQGRWHPARAQQASVMAGHSSLFLDLHMGQWCSPSSPAGHGLHFIESASVRRFQQVANAFLL